MYNHKNKNYICPFCLLVKWIESPILYTKESDIIYKDDFLIAFIWSHGWENNHCNVLIIPKIHIENIYDLPENIWCKIFSLSKKIALAMKKAYKCDWISFRQHNESYWNQDVFHYHYNILPRYKNDNLYLNFDKLFKIPEEERLKYAKLLKKYLK